jgi:ribonucleoside-diphosphate reductase alpha chain
MKAGSDVGKQSIPPSLEIRGDEVYNVYPEIEVLRPDVRLVKYEPDGEGKGGEKVVTKEELIGRVDENGIVKINAEIPFRLIAEYAHSRGDPGLIFLDAIERDNMLPSAGRLDTTNPCGEQPLHPYDACNLGSVNLKQFVTDSKDVDYDRLEGVVRSAVRFMDNVNDLNRGPIPKIEETVRNHRRIGLGVMGWADMLMKMRIGYDSEKGYDLAEKVMGFVDEIAKSESINLARTKGVFPMFDDSNYDDSTRVRNLARTTIAPTGSISMVADANSGIEPWYGLIYYKQMRGGDKVRIVNSEFSLALEERGIVGEDVEKILSAVEGNGGSCQGIDGVPEEIQKVFKTSGDISYNAHIEMQSRFQKHVDNAISKTINVPKSGSVEDILNAYDLAHKQGCKGITVYRDGSLETQVLNIGDGGSVKSSRRELLEGMVSKELARPRPEDVEGPTMKIPTPHGHNAFVTFNWATNGDGKDHPYECFVNIGKAGGDLPALSEMGGRLISTLLKVGVNPNYIVKQLEGIEGQQSTGFGKERVTSLPDAFAQAIKKALDKKGYDGGVVDGVVVEGEGVDGVVEGGVVETVLIKDEPQVTSNLCPECMGMLVKEEGCIKCHQCGFSRC